MYVLLIKKALYLSLCFLLVDNSIVQQGIFSKIKANCNQSEQNYKYRIVFVNDTTAIYKCSYLGHMYYAGFSEYKKLQMMEELLKYQNDKSLSALPVRCYNPKISKVYSGVIKDYSLQVEALFLINQIYFDDPYMYSPFPLLLNKNANTINEEKTIQTAFKLYKNWYNKIKSIGIAESRKQRIFPLDKNIVWYSGRSW